MAFIGALFGVGLGALFMYLYLVEFQDYKKPEPPKPSIDISGR